MLFAAAFGTFLYAMTCWFVYWHVYRDFIPLPLRKGETWVEQRLNGLWTLSEDTVTFGQCEYAVLIQRIPTPGPQHWKQEGQKWILENHLMVPFKRGLPSIYCQIFGSRITDKKGSLYKREGDVFLVRGVHFERESLTSVRVNAKLAHFSLSQTYVCDYHGSPKEDHVSASKKIIPLKLKWSESHWFPPES